MKRWIAGLVCALVCSHFLFASPQALAGVNRTVRFAPGTSGTVIDGVVYRGDNDVYTLRASGGQTMHCSVHALAGGGAALIVTAPNGENLSEGDSRWSGQLPMSGTYRIVIVPTGGNSKYSLNISIR